MYPVETRELTIVYTPCAFTEPQGSCEGSSVGQSPCDRSLPPPAWGLLDLSSFVETRQVMMNTFQMSCKEKDITSPFCMVRIPLKTRSLSLGYFRTSFISQGKMKNRRNHVSFAVCCRSEMLGYIRVFPATCSLSSKLDGEHSEFEEHL